MNGNFVYCNPTKLYFGEDSLDFLNEELPKYGKNVVLVYGAGSIKENGIYDKVINILKKNEKNIAEIAEKLGLPLGTVKSRIFFTRQRLQGQLRDFV